MTFKAYAIGVIQTLNNKLYLFEFGRNKVHTSWVNLTFSVVQALLVLHQPEIIELWNPDAPMETFWDIRYDLVRIFA